MNHHRVELKLKRYNQALQFLLKPMTSPELSIAFGTPTSNCNDMISTLIESGNVIKCGRQYSNETHKYTSLYQTINPVYVLKEIIQPVKIEVTSQARVIRFDGLTKESKDLAQKLVETERLRCRKSKKTFAGTSLYGTII